MKKLMSFKTKGMNQDLSVSAFNPEFSFENMNLRLSTNEHNTTLSWVNEKGTKKIEIDDSDNTIRILGIPIGTAIINHKLIIFTCQNDKGFEDPTSVTPTIYPDHIYQFRNDLGHVDIRTLYAGDLNFKASNPLETLVSYESDNIQKVYWVDGRNQPRVINVGNGGKTFNYTDHHFTDSQFDFVTTFALPLSAYVTKLPSGGTFAPGIIQYCFTYFNKFGQQSNIVWVSSLQYISHSDRGASPEETVNNAFKIQLLGLDGNFDFVRIYSIQRTALDGAPIVKILTDIEIPQTTKVEYIDTGTTGSIADPQILLYIGGKELIAGTMVDKDQTLFVGNITEKNLPLLDLDLQNVQYGFDYKVTHNDIVRNINRGTLYRYDSTLQFPEEQITGFKGGEWYRFGFQLQRRTGEWTEPIWLTDAQNLLYPTTNNDDDILLPTFKATLDLDEILDSDLSNYIGIRPLTVFPTINDRTVLCQGVLNPTVFNAKDRAETKNNIESSWFFRPFVNDAVISEYEDATSQLFGLGYRGSFLRYKHYDSIATRNSLSDKTRNRVEIQEAYADVSDLYTKKSASSFISNTQFFIDQSVVTLHSPDLEFNTEVQSLNLSNLKLRIVGLVPIDSYASYHSIVASARLPLNVNSGEDSTISSDSTTPSANVIEANVGTSGELEFNLRMGTGAPLAGLRLVSEYLWEDAYVSRKTEKNVEIYSTLPNKYKYIIYPWHRRGSLNGDPASDDTASALLKTKKTSHISFSKITNYFFNSINVDPQDYDSYSYDNLSVGLHLTENEYVYNIKVGDYLYKPNVDKILYGDSNAIIQAYPENGDPVSRFITPVIPMKYRSTSHAVIAFGKVSDGGDDVYPILPAGRLDDSGNTTIGETSVPHAHDPLYWETGQSSDYGFTQNIYDINKDWFVSDNNFVYAGWLWLGELYRDTSDTTRFGGNTTEAKRNNNWLIGGYTQAITDSNKTALELEWNYGDTYFQRYDCLKTYPFTFDDINQNVEILSFMCESYINIDGRYDRNRGAIDNTNMHPKNFNILNPAYSQRNNYFTYKIVDHDANTKGRYPNWITYTQTKQSGSDIDEWTHLTLGSVLEMDGDKGEVRALKRLNDQIIAFQDNGISQILYNENTAISSTEGVPIEIANSGKVQGKRYFTDTVGCTNKWSICQSPMGLYFIDSDLKNIYLFNGQINDISTSKGFNTWSKQHINSDIWRPDTFIGFKSVYDPINQEVLFINSSTALAFSEKLNTFTSFYNYGGAPYFESMDGNSYWINKGYDKDGIYLSEYGIYEHQTGDYCNFFGKEKPYWMTLVGNPEPQIDKIFTNLEFRACVDGDGENKIDNIDGKTYERYKPYLPFDYILSWNEYQRGSATLSSKYGREVGKHFMSSDYSLKRKFRMWRCDIPRDNALTESTFDDTFDYTFHGTRVVHRLDRMRNPWIYLTLKKGSETNRRTEIHDLVMTYYN